MKLKGTKADLSHVAAPQYCILWRNILAKCGLSTHRWSVLTSAMWLLSQIPNFLPNLLNSPSLGQPGRSHAGHLSAGKITLEVSVMCDRTILMEKLPGIWEGCQNHNPNIDVSKSGEARLEQRCDSNSLPKTEHWAVIACRRAACVCVAPGLSALHLLAQGRQNRTDQLRNSWMFPLLAKPFERSFLCLPTGKLFQECIRQIHEWIAAQVLKHVNQQFKPSDCNCTASSKSQELSSNTDHHLGTHQQML